ncbi:MAG: hypothetical protein IPG55_00240 [Saprospiraceae bacterium]|nr:hypothetical protein [Candidatus Defluviibacterium haderslevense]
MTDSFRIILPNPIQVINGSLKVISNIDISGYRIIQSNNSSELIVPMVDGIMPNQIISFSFRLRNFKFWNVRLIFQVLCIPDKVYSVNLLKPIVMFM